MMKKWVLVLTIVPIVLLLLHFSSFEVVLAPPVGSDNVTLYSIADAYVNSTTPETNYGSEASMYVGANSEQDFLYVKFDLTSIPSGANVSQALLEIYLSGKGGSIYGLPADTIGAYYCPNNSWNELGITWNNKPSFNPNPTGSWSFSLFYTYKVYKSWDVTADVQMALTSGNITEVLKFASKTGDGYASFHSREGASKPKLSVAYSTQPVFSVNLESVQDTGTTNNLGLTTLLADQPREIGAYTFSLPNTMDFVVGSYQMKYSGGYMFMRWETSGGVTVSDANAATTNVTVSAGGTLRAVGNVKRLEYTYDREYSILHTGFYELQEAGEMSAVRFTPLFSGQLFMARFYIYQISSYTSNAVKIHVMDENRQDIITPFEQTPTSKGWLDVDLSSYSISVNNGTDFYIGMEWIVDYYPYLGGDDTWTVSNRSWSVNGTDWKETKALTIRAVVGTLCDHVVAEDGKVFQIITESNSTLSDFQFIKENKKVLFNVTGTAGTSGFCNITMPNQLLGGPFNVTFDEQPLSEVLSFDNGTHTWLYLTYPQSGHRIEISGTTVIPEFPSAILLPLFTFITIVVVVLTERFDPKHWRKLPIDRRLVLRRLRKRII